MKLILPAPVSFIFWLAADIVTAGVKLTVPELACMISVPLLLHESVPAILTVPVAALSV